MEKARAYIVVQWALVAAWAAFIFFMSAHTGSDFEEGDDLVSKMKMWLDGVGASIFGPGVDVVSPVAHFLEYTVFGVLVMVAVRSTFGLSAARAVLVSLAVCAAYAGSDELHQLFVPGRACDPADWLVDVSGSLFGAALALLLGRMRAARRRSADAFPL